MTLECPLCDWTEESEQDRYAQSNQAAARAAAAALGMPADALLPIHAHQAARRDETTLHDHLATHPPEDWLPALMQARKRADNLAGDAPQIVCLCGSTRFKTEFEDANRRLTREGLIVLAPGVYEHAGDPITEEEKQRLDLLHRDKIDLAHQVVVINPGGYIGDSTRREIEYAKHTCTPVLYIEAGGSENG